MGLKFMFLRSEKETRCFHSLFAECSVHLVLQGWLRVEKLLTWR